MSGTVLVAGSGAAGLTAALAAAAGGAQVMLAERSGRLGGTSALSGGRVWIPAHGLGPPGDSPGLAREYLRGLFPARYSHMTEAFLAGYRRRYPLPGLPAGGQVPAWVASSGSLRGLAGSTGVDPDGLECTVAAWNQACAAGHDPDFGRGDSPYDRYGGDPAVRPNPCLGPVAEPPFYAVRVLAGTIGTKGGPVTDADGRVLTASGAPIPGLYAAGNVAAFWTGDAYPAPGATLGIAMTFGYLAGRAAASGSQIIS